MTGLARAALPLPVLEDDLPTGRALWGAGQAMERIESDINAKQATDAKALLDEMYEALPRVEDKYGRDEADIRGAGGGIFAIKGMGNDAFNDAAMEMAFTRIEAARLDDRAAYRDLPDSRAAFEAELTRRRQAEYDEAKSVVDAAGELGGWSEFGGRMIEGATDQWNVATMMLGAPAGSSVKAAIAIEALLGGASEAMMIPRQARVAEELDIEPPNVAAQILGGAAIGGVVGGVAGLLGRAARGAEDVRGGLDVAPGIDPAEVDAGLERGRAALDEGLDAARPETGPSATESPLVRGIRETAEALGMDPQDLATIISYETGGTFDALQRGPTTQWGQHRGLIQFGEPQARQYGVDWNDPLGSQLGADGAIVRYFRQNGWEEGMDLLDAYSIVNAGGPGRYGASDAGNGGAPGTVRDKVEGQMDGHRRNAAELFGGTYVPRPSRGGGAGPAAGPSRRGYTRSGQVTAGEITLDVDYEVVDLDELRAASGALQPRDRSRAASAEQIDDMAARLDPARLMPWPEADRGAPVVAPDGTVESGNGRVAAIRRAAEKAPDRYEAYRASLEAAGYDVPEGVARPVLIARRRTELDEAGRQAFVRAANASTTARMAPSEQARIDARAMTLETMELYDPGADLASAANRDFARAALAGIPLNERTALYTDNGALGIAGQMRLQQAMFARSYDAPDILAAALEVGAGDLRSLLDGLQLAAPAWSRMRAGVAQGRIREEMDVTPWLLQAVRLIGEARGVARREAKAVGGVLEELLADVDLLAGALPQATVALVRLLMPEGRAARGDALAAFLRRYAAEADGAAGEAGGLFAQPGALDVLKRMEPEAFRDVTEMGRPPAGRTDFAASGAFDPGGDPLGFDEGAASRLAQVADDDALARAIAEADAAEAIEVDPKAQLSAWKAEQPFDDLDGIMAASEGAQARLIDALTRIGARHGFEVKNPGVKARDTVAEKMARKGYAGWGEMTDVSRAGVVLPDDGTAERIARELGADFEVLDEGWTRTQAGYVDRKMIVRHPDGTLSELQLWSQAMYAAKKGRGTELYNELRGLADITSPRAVELSRLSVEHYSAAEASEPWTAGIEVASTPKRFANRSSQAASGRTAAVKNTSVTSTSVQPASGESLARARNTPGSSSSTAGRPSQSENVRGMEASDAEGNTTNVGADDAPRKADDLSDVRRLAAELEEIEAAEGVETSARMARDLIRQDDLLGVVDVCPTGRGI